SSSERSSCLVLVSSRIAETTSVVLAITPPYKIVNSFRGTGARRHRGAAVTNRQPAERRVSRRADRDAALRPPAPAPPCPRQAPPRSARGLDRGRRASR